MVKDDIVKGGFDLIVVDEANAYKNPTTNRWKILNEIVRETNPGCGCLLVRQQHKVPLDAYG
jgi:ATP-dependent DNA ligase